MIRVNGTAIGNKKFPNGETIFKEDLFKNHPVLIRSIPDGHSYIYIDFKFEDDADIFNLIVIKKYIDEKYDAANTLLNMAYIPYSRMDRKIEGYVFSLKYFCQIINDLNFSRVIVLDPHSNVSTALLNHCDESINLVDNIQTIVLKKTPDYIFYPDNGACKRYTEVLKVMKDINGIDVPYFYGNKKRNLQTGEITDYELVDCPSNIKGKTILIVDDLCSKGFTFVNAGMKLKEKGAEKVYLYVSHCENSVYDGLLLKEGSFVDKIFTTDSILTNWASDRIVKL